MKGALKEFSVIYSDRAVNLMSAPFQTVMKDISKTLKAVHNARSAIVVPGSGTYAMEAVARQFGTGKDCLVVRNGFFSYRWSAIFDQCHIPSKHTVVKGVMMEEGPKAAWGPPPIDSLTKQIKEEKPGVVFAPHIETSTGILLPDGYVKALADAAHEVGALFVLDCIASGTLWVDMQALGVDVLISAPQKGWSGPACCGLVMLSEHARQVIDSTTSTSFSVDLKKWLEVMEKYEGGAFMYHTTLPTDSLITFRDVMMETEKMGWEKSRAAMMELGGKIRGVLESRGFKSVAAEGFKAPDVVVSYSDDAQMLAKFKEQGLQIAGGVPFMLDEPANQPTFRIGLFGLDKMADIDSTVATFQTALDKIIG